MWESEGKTLNTFLEEWILKRFRYKIKEEVNNRSSLAFDRAFISVSILIKLKGDLYQR